MLSDAGDLLVSGKLPEEVLASLALKRGLDVGGFKLKQCVSLGWHSENYGFPE